MKGWGDSLSDGGRPISLSGHAVDRMVQAEAAYSVVYRKQEMIEVQLFDKHDIPPGNWPGLAEASSSYVSIRRRLLVEHDLTEGTGKINNAGCIEFYRQMVCRRLLDSAEAISLLWRSQLQVPCLLQVRALLETVVVLNHFVRGIKRFHPRDQGQELHEFITKIAFSSRDNEKVTSLDLYQSTNILTQINSLLPEYRILIRKFYDQICDYCHPNGYAMYQRYGDIIDQKFVAMPVDYKREVTFEAVQNTAHLLSYADGLMFDIDDVLSRIRASAHARNLGG